MATGEKPILSVRVRTDLLERIDAIAQQADVGRAQVVERLLDIGLENQEELVSMLKSPVIGLVAQLATHPKFLKLVSAFVSSEFNYDVTTLKLRDETLKKKRGKGKAGHFAPA